MISVSAKVRLPRLEVDCPDKAFFQRVAITEIREIHKRTLQGTDADETAFKPYSKAYAKVRAKAGRTSQVNLTFSGRMLASMARAIKLRKNGATIYLAGSSGFKAWNLEEKGREFFAISDKRGKAIYDKVREWLTKKNGLK